MTLNEAAIEFEAQSCITRKDKTGWVLGLRIHPDDLPKAVILAPLGARFRCVLFEIADDETITVPEEVRLGKRAVAAAGQLCREPAFQNWILSDCPPLSDDDAERMSAEALREHLGILSRSEIGEDEEAREAFTRLIETYRKETRDG
jgi:hypothetical protein